MSPIEIAGAIAVTVIAPFVIGYIWDLLRPWRLRQQQQALEEANRRYARRRRTS